MQKRGQLMEQPFIYIFALVLMAFIILFGFSAVKRFNVFGEDVQIATFVKDLENNVDEYYYYSLGSSNKINLKIPSKVKCVCISNAGSILDESELSKCNDPLIKDVIENSEKNIFISPVREFKINSYEIKNIKAIKNPLCVETNGNFKAVLETKKDYVEIRAFSSETGGEGDGG